jgi:tetratricopeptide (TPR) repeat protein
MRHFLVVLPFLALAPGCPAAAQVADATKAHELVAAGRYQAALPYFERELDARAAQLGPNDPELATDLNDLAEVNRRLGRLEVAETLYQRAIALDEKAGPSNAAGLATSLNNLALVYKAQGRLAEAEKLHARSLRLLEDTLGPNQPDVARGMNNLAALYREEGKLGDARQLQERAVAIAEATLGRKHADTQKMRRTLASLGNAPEGDAEAAAIAREQRPAPRTPGKAALPPPPIAPEPGPTRAVSRAGGGFALQLAAVQAPDQVAPEWRRLVKRYRLLEPLELQPPQTVEVAGKGTFYRVIAGPLRSQAEAEAMCAKLRKAGAACRLAKW